MGNETPKLAIIDMSVGDSQPSYIIPHQPVEVRSGHTHQIGRVEELKWDTDQWTYKVHGKWYRKSEITGLTEKQWESFQHIKTRRHGVSNPLLNTYR